MRPAVCEACGLIVRRLVDTRAGELVVVELEPWVDEDGRQHWAVHDCRPALFTPQDMQPSEQYL
jgi:hypothetical protein